MPIKHIKKKSVSEAVFTQIKDAISSGEWTPGSKIPSENELAQRMGVSRMSVRSALQKLSSLGVVESRQGEGTFVCELNGGQYINSMIPMVMLEKQDAFYMLEFRRLLECESAALAARRATPENLSILKTNYAKMQKVDQFSEESSRLDIEFHFELAKSTQNPMLIQVYGILKDVFLVSLRDISRMMSQNNAPYYHKALIDAISIHDAARARALMEEHLDSTMQDIMEPKQS